MNSFYGRVLLPWQFHDHDLGDPQGLEDGLRGGVTIASLRLEIVDRRHRVIQERSPLFRLRLRLRIEESVRIARDARAKATAPDRDPAVFGGRLNGHGQRSLRSPGTPVGSGLTIERIRVGPIPGVRQWAEPRSSRHARGRSRHPGEEAGSNPEAEKTHESL